MKTHEEIKRGLEYCVNGPCPGKACPYYADDDFCAYDKSKDSLALIQQLEAENAELNGNGMRR